MRAGTLKMVKTSRSYVGTCGRYGDTISTGTGQMMVLWFSAEMVLRHCKYRNQEAGIMAAGEDIMYLPEEQLDWS